jgi:predicted dehydrogenase
LLEPGQAYGGVKFQINHGGGFAGVDVKEVDQIVGEMDGFARAINGNGAFKATGEEGLRDVRIIEGIYESARVGKSVKV